MGTTGPIELVSLVALSDGPGRRSYDEKPTTWREDWDRRMADLSAWERDARRFKRLGVLSGILRRCNRVDGDYGPARRWGIREAISRLHRLAARAGGAK